MRLAFALYGTVAGVIERTGARTRLEYLPQYQDLENPTPLSLSMPVASTSYPAKPVEAYLRGLLPDHSDVRERWAAKAGVRAGDWLGLVAHVGLDVSGGAVFAPEATIAQTLDRPGALTPASERDIAAKLRRVRQDDGAWQDDDEQEHWSLAGAQSKFTLARTSDGWAFADGRAPSTHIVKPGISKIRAQALSEHVSMRALALAGLPVAETQYLTFEDQDAVVVTRFDRSTARSGATVRIHQEDMLQAFAMDPRRKYEENGGPGVQRIADLLRGAAGLDSVERFARAVIANQILGAPDAHAKNFGLVLIGAAVDLTRLYDVATGLIPDSAGRLRYTKGAMSVGGERRFGDVERVHWERFARAVGLAPSTVIGWVGELAETLPPAFEQAANETRAPDSDFLAGVVASNVAAVAAATKLGLVRSRRVGGRLVVPFVQTVNSSAPSALPSPAVSGEGPPDVGTSAAGLGVGDETWGV